MATMKSKSSGTYEGSYGTFLETLRLPATEGLDESLIARILKTIETQGGKTTMKDLLGRIDVAPIQLVKAVETMKNQDIVRVTSTPSDDLVELTQVGQSVAKLTSSE
jgi:hypothetical protein